ncbi:MAG: type II toxin-antitoxin system HicA family toxin [Chloroflexi bacterium]|nr:type II toxin-antitoxin system HicA family toxin [Chloroflexota bacterium]MCL5076310.1 type II toxin-antitoxin system HicA family toxin [Chloroflexota bacterium]
MSKLPQVKGDRLVSALRKAGWYVDHTRGGHVIMRHEDRPGVKIIIPVHRKPVKPGTLSNILKKAELSAEEIKRLL